jgi:pimeloyl-ACP methyl ester carboxylesterase
LFPEQQTSRQKDEVRELAVMDAAGMGRATLVTTFSTAGPAALVAAKAPDRVQGIVMLNPVAQGPGAETPLEWDPGYLAGFLASRTPPSIRCRRLPSAR